MRCCRSGFGFVEAGTVTPQPQSGNPKPRLFRLDEDRAVINRLGFNSGGVGAFAQRLIKRQRRAHARGIVGANVGKNRDTTDGAADYVACIEQLSGLSDYLVVNLSSPNTPGLRGLQARAPIEDLLRRVLLARKRAAPNPEKPPPLLAKVGPDLTTDQLRDIAEASLGAGVDGLIVGNTTIERPDELQEPRQSRSRRPFRRAAAGAVHRLPRRDVPADQGPPAAHRLRRGRERRRRLCQDPRRRVAGAGLFRAGVRGAGPRPAHQAGVGASCCAPTALSASRMRSAAATDRLRSLWRVR